MATSRLLGVSFKLLLNKGKKIAFCALRMRFVQKEAVIRQTVPHVTCLSSPRRKQTCHLMVSDMLQTSDTHTPVSLDVGLIKERRECCLDKKMERRKRLRLFFFWFTDSFPPEWNDRPASAHVWLEHPSWSPAWLNAVSFRMLVLFTEESHL